MTYRMRPTYHQAARDADAEQAELDKVCSNAEVARQAADASHHATVIYKTTLDEAKDRRLKAVEEGLPRRPLDADVHRLQAMVGNRIWAYT